MKTHLLLAATFLASVATHGQGTFIYDQQSSTQEGSPGYGVGGQIQGFTPPWGQSFTPGLTGVDFIRLTLDDGSLTGSSGAAGYLNLRSDSITGPILGTTATVSMPGGFSGQATFYFASRVALTPGTTYFFEPVISAPGPWYIFSEAHTYPGGSAFNGGLPNIVSDLWFREGIITIPEPSSAAILLVGVLVLFSRRHAK